MESKNEMDSIHADLENGDYWISERILSLIDVDEIPVHHFKRLTNNCIKRVKPNEVVVKIKSQYFDDISNSFGFNLLGQVEGVKIRFASIRYFKMLDVFNIEIIRYLPFHPKYKIWDEIYLQLVNEIEKLFGNQIPAENASREEIITQIQKMFGDQIPDIKDPFEVWFEFRHSIDNGITLKHISAIKYYDYGYVRNLHSIWNKEYTE